MYINIIINWLVFKIKDRFTFELRLKPWNYLVAQKKLIEKTKNGEKVVEVVLLQCKLTDNQYQKKDWGVIYFSPNKSNAYMSNVKPDNLVLMKTYHTEFNKIFYNIYESKC